MHDRAFLRRAWWSLLWLLPLPLLADASGLDLWLERFYFDPVQQDFPWRHVWWFNVFLHDGLRTLLVFGVFAIAGLLLLSVAAPQYLASYAGARAPRPRVLAYLLVAALGGPLVIALLKQVTARPCPWSLSLFGGGEVYHALLAGPLFSLREAGNCFPGAHASGGFALLAFVPLLRGRQRWLALGVALGLGLLMGWTRMMQGAHFLSHNLWSAWICWAVTLAACQVIRPGEN